MEFNPSKRQVVWLLQPQTQLITGNVNLTLGFIRKVRTKLPKVGETAYNTLIRPKMEYASPYGTPFPKIRLTTLSVNIRLKRSKGEQLAGPQPQVILALGQMLQRCWKNLAGDLSNRDELMHVAVCSTVSSMDFWQFLYLNITQPNTRVSRYCHSMAFCQVHTSADYYKYSFIPLQLSSGILSQTGWCAAGKLHHSRPYILT